MMFPGKQKRALQVEDEHLDRLYASLYSVVLFNRGVSPEDLDDHFATANILNIFDVWTCKRTRPEDNGHPSFRYTLKRSIDGKPLFLSPERRQILSIEFNDGESISTMFAEIEMWRNLEVQQGLFPGVRSAMETAPEIAYTVQETLARIQLFPRILFTGVSGSRGLLCGHREGHLVIPLPSLSIGDTGKFSNDIHEGTYESGIPLEAFLSGLTTSRG